MNKDKLKDIFQPSNYEVDLFKQKILLGRYVPIAQQILDYRS